MSEHDDFRDWDAAYVTGMLSPEERRAFERHLATCPACTAAVAELAGLPGILNLLTPAEAEALLSSDAAVPSEGGAERVQHLARSVGRRRGLARRRVAGGIAGVAGLLAIVAVFAGVAIGQTAGAGAPGPEAAATASPSPIAPGTPGAPGAGDGAVARAMSQVEPGWIDAQLTVTEKGWGTRFDWGCSYRDEWSDTDEPVTYDLVVTDASGSETTVASWSARGEAAGNLSASTSIPTDQIRSVDIRVAGSDRPIVRTTL